MCDEYESYHDGTGRPVVGGQSCSSFVPSVIKTNVLLNNDDLAHKEFRLQRYGERIEKLSQQDRLSKFCTDAGFLTTVEVGQYFMTEDTEEFSQFTDSVACREYTLPRDEDTSEPKRWIRGNTKIRPALEVSTCCLQGKYGVEIRIKTVNKDNSHSWVRISHGMNKLVTNLNNNEQETSEMQFEECALKLNAGDFASRSKAKAKQQKRDSASSSTRTIPIGERTWTDIEQEYSLSDYPVSKKLINLLRHGRLPREDDGAIEFWRIKDHLRNHFVHSQHQSDEKWKSSMAGGGGQKKIFQYFLILQEQFSTSELFKLTQDSAQSMEETSKHGILGRHQSCSEEKIEILSDQIERYHSSRNTPSLLYPESCSDGNCRSQYEKYMCHLVLLQRFP